MLTWGRREPSGLFGVEENARRVGHYRWAEIKLFEALGGWVATVPEPAVKMCFGEHCHQHAWHADLWHHRLPQVREMTPDSWTVPANEAFVAFVDAVAEPQGAQYTIEKLVGVYRVFLPHLISAYTFHLNATSSITDAPTVRALRLILHDDLEDWREGEMLIQSLISTPQDVDRAAERQSQLEKLIVAAGGVAGPGSIG